MMKQLKAGDRITLKVRTISGWKGSGTVVSHSGDHVVFVKDGDRTIEMCDCMRYECRKTRKPQGSTHIDALAGLPVIKKEK